MAVVVLVAARAWAGAPADVDVLAKALAKPVAIIQGKVPAFTATLALRVREGDGDQAIELTVARLDAQQFALSVKSLLVGLVLTRTADATLLVVPSAAVGIVGKGPLPPDSDLEPGKLFTRMAGAWPVALTAVGVIQSAEPGAVALLLQMLLDLQQQPDKTPATYLAKRASGKGALTLELAPEGDSVRRLDWTGKDTQASLAIALRDEAAIPSVATEGLQLIEVPRPELERALGRGLARAVQIFADQQQDHKLRDTERSAGRGRLAIRKGSRLVTLQGTPYEIGFQHGRLLAAESRRLADSMLYVLGIYHAVTKREWLLDTLRGALQRLQPHILPEYVEEMKGVADGSGLTLEEVQLANILPELFHCSGFALLGKATAGGRLYHGRVLDYMTEVGLQREAAVFVIKKDGAIPFANVGYAGFVGSVSGMNAERVAIGEMGGRGEGRWDGTPMTLLVRRGLERARRLDEAMAVFRDAKRTCEYYYVISDGNAPSAVGVGATPETIEFVRPGQAHPKLPVAVEDAVLLSAGDRYTKLVGAVKAKYGRIDEQAAIDLMKRPVAMKSNLHNVLFVPQDLVFHVANARGRKPACDQPYTRFDLKAILDDMAKPRGE